MDGEGFGSKDVAFSASSHVKYIRTIDRIFFFDFIFFMWKIFFDMFYMYSQKLDFYFNFLVEFLLKYVDLV